MTDESETAAPQFEIIARQRVHDGFLRLDRYSLRQRYFKGGLTPRIEREIVVAREAVAVICYDPVRDAVVLVEQARLAAQLAGFPAISTEIVAGLIDPNETAEACAVREVAEETGLSPLGPLVPITHMVTTPGHSTEAVHLFCARVEAKGVDGRYHGVESEHEDIRLLILSFDEFTARMEDQRIANSFTLVAGLWLRLNRNRLRALWGTES